jgi:hypothetical protein
MRKLIIGIAAAATLLASAPAFAWDTAGGDCNPGLVGPPAPCYSHGRYIGSVGNVVRHNGQFYPARGAGFVGNDGRRGHGSRGGEVFHRRESYYRYGYVERGTTVSYMDCKETDNATGQVIRRWRQPLGTTCQ